MVRQGAPEAVKPVFEAAREVQDFLRLSGSEFCFIGGVALGALSFEHHCVERGSEFDFGPGLKLLTCSAEDLVVLKAFAGRGQDWVDLKYVLVRQRRTLDWRLIVDELKPLLEPRETPDNLEKLQQLRSKVEKGA